MKQSLLIFFCFISFEILGQSSLGIGFASVEFEANTTLNFYSSSDSQQPSKQVKFINNEEINSITFQDNDEVQNWLNPETLWLDYYQFILRVVNKREGWLEVVVNETNKNTLWIKDDKNITYRTWGAYLKDLFNIERKDTIEQKLFSAPNSNKQIEYSGMDCFKVIKIEDEWIQVTSHPYCDSFENWTTKIDSAWIKWKKNDTLLINCFTTP